MPQRRKFVKHGDWRTCLNGTGQISITFEAAQIFRQHPLCDVPDRPF